MDLVGGTKHDRGKPRYDLIPSEAMKALATQLAFGAEKYGDRNWEQGIHFGRLVRAATGHLWDFWAGEELDEEGRPHLNGAITSLAMLLSLVQRYGVGSEWDDRPVKPNMEAQMQRTVTYLRENPDEIEEFTAMLRAAFPEVDSPADEVKVGLAYGVAETYIPYNPELFQDFKITHNPPVDTSVNSAVTDQSTGEDTHIHKLTRHKRIMCKGLPKNNFLGRWHYHWHMVTCPECLELRA